MSRWARTAIERGVAVGAIGVAVCALAAHASTAVGGGGYLNYVSGIWLALARDWQQGVFYREVFAESGYGGTRYFPLFFGLIALFMRAGAAALTAGWLASGVAAAVLTTGMYRLVRSLGGARTTALVFAAGAVAPYFVQQTLFEIRADVLAAALNVWGLAFLLPAWGRDRMRQASPGLAALFFTLALSTKVTSLAIPGAAVAGTFLAGRRSLSAGLLWRLAAGALLFFGLVHWASGGKALESWRACMFAGTGAGGTVGLLLGGDFLQLTRYSRLLTGLLLIVVAALAAGLFWPDREADRSDQRRALWVPAMLFLGASASTAIALSSPGTVPSNQMVEWIEIAFVVLAFLVCTRTRLARALSVVAAVLVLWASAQEIVRTRERWDLRADQAESAERQRFLARVAATPGPVLAESPLWPVLAGREVYLLDPFALRVIMQSRPDIERDLVGKIERRVFPLVILQFDPTTRSGRGYYENVNFGWPVTEKILAHYRLDSHPLADVYVYVPRD